MFRWIGPLRRHLSPQIRFRYFSSTKRVESDYSHAIIGAGVVGLAIGSELAKEPSNRVLIIEKNSTYGSETSSRNSEVIHAGLYYPEDSLKTRLCISGKESIYNEAAPNGVEVLQCGKWIVAQNEQQAEYLERLHSKAKSLNIPTEMISVERAKKLEPSVRVQTAVLNSPTTGILSAHSLMDYYISIFQDNVNSDLVLGTLVTHLNYDPHSSEYQIFVETEDTEEGMSGNDQDSYITVDSVINSAGLHAASISNLLLPEERHVKQYYAKGNYFSYNSSAIKVNRLIYPSPTPGIKSLGTHLTIDLGGQIKFGPDLEWVDSCDDFAVNANNLEAAYKEVSKYLPDVKLEDMAPIMAGIRPKLIGPSDNSFQDFVIREEEGFPGFINLLAIESPGLTSSFAIAKYVKDLLE